jgi:hypothetical protein
MLARLKRFALLTCLLATPAAFAAPMTYELTGTVFNAQGIYGNIELGSAVDAFFTIDLSQAAFSASQPGIEEFGGADLVTSEVFVNGVNIAQNYDPTVYTSAQGIDASFLNLSNGAIPSLYELYNQYSGSNTYTSVYEEEPADSSAFSLDGAIPQLAAGDSGTGVLQSNVEGFSGLDYSVSRVSPVIVPAPLSLGLLCIGLAGTAMRRRRGGIGA